MQRERKASEEKPEAARGAVKRARLPYQPQTTCGCQAPDKVLDTFYLIPSSQLGRSCYETPFYR